MNIFPRMLVLLLLPCLTAPATDDPPHRNKQRSVGGAALIQLGLDEFLLAGSDLRLNFDLARLSSTESVELIDIEEGTFENGRWVRNGGQLDWGLNLTKPTLLEVRLGTYR